MILSLLKYSLTGKEKDEKDREREERREERELKKLELEKAEAAFDFELKKLVS